MSDNDFSNIGKQIQDAVEDAIDSMNFKQLNKTISDTVSDAVDEVRKQFTGSSQPGYRRRYENQTYREHTPSGSSKAKPDRSDQTVRRTASQKPASASSPVNTTSPPDLMDKFRIHPPSRIKGILLTVFGSIGLGISLLLLFLVLMIALFSATVWGAAWGLTVFLLITTLICLVLIYRGNSIRGQAARLKLYLLEVDKKAYCSIRDLVGRTGKAETFIVKDLKKMIKTGILPHAHIDEKSTCLMLDDETYKQYLQTVESMKIRQKAEQEEQHTDINNKTSRVTEEGEKYLTALREANQAIPGEVISAKLDRLETVIEKIFLVVDKHPNQLDDIERFMDYYLPTTIKLISAYRDFDSVGFSGENISMAKTEVEETLDTINHAFEQLLDGLYQEEAFDVSTDASVLQTMLKKDGYVNNDFDRRDES